MKRAVQEKADRRIEKKVKIGHSMNREKKGQDVDSFKCETNFMERSD